jgi:hypothetical protein
MGIELLPQAILGKYAIKEWKHACAILKYDFPNEWTDIICLLSDFKLCKSWIVEAGGRKSKSWNTLMPICINEDGKRSNLKRLCMLMTK